jgi:hypothetical protein
VLDGRAGGVVVVAKYFFAEADAAAAMAVGEDVAALESGGLFWIWSRHMRGGPHPLKRSKYSFEAT